MCTGNWCIFIMFVMCANTDITWLYVLPVDCHIVVSVCCTVHVKKSQWMQQLMYNYSLIYASVTLEVQLLGLWEIENLWLTLFRLERHFVTTRSLTVSCISAEATTNSQTGAVNRTCQLFLSFVKPSSVRMCRVTVSVLRGSVILGRSQ